MRRRLTTFTAPQLTDEERFNVASYFTHRARYSREAFERRLNAEVNERTYRVPDLQPPTMDDANPSVSETIRHAENYSMAAGHEALQRLRTSAEARRRYIDPRQLRLQRYTEHMVVDGTPMDQQARLVHRVFALREAWQSLHVHELWAATMASVIEMVPGERLDSRLTVQVALINTTALEVDDQFFAAIRPLASVGGSNLDELSLTVFGMFMSNLNKVIDQDRVAKTGSDRLVMNMEYEAIQVAVLMHDYRAGRLGAPWTDLLSPEQPIRTVEIAGCVCLLKEPSKPYYCLLEALNLMDERATIASLERDLHITGELTGPLPFHCIKQLAYQRGWRVFLYHAKSPNVRARCVDKAGSPNALLSIHVLLLEDGENSHYFPIITRTVKKLCIRCGVRFTATHSCNAGVMGYYQRQVLKKKTKTAEMAGPVRSVDDTLWDRWCNDYDRTYCFYDMETAEFEDSAIFTVYHVGALFVYKDEQGALTKEYRSWYGADDHRVLEQFMTAVMSESLKRGHPVKLVSHNGARFDAFFLVRWYLEYTMLQRRTCPEHPNPWPLIGRGEERTMGITLGAFKTLEAVNEERTYGFVHFDMYLHLARSLNVLAKTFLGADNGKDYFPHSFLKSKVAEEVLAYRGERPPVSFFQPKSGPRLTEEDLDAAGLSRTDFDLRALSERYLRQDIELTFRVFQAYASGVSVQFDRPATEWGLVSNCVTLSQMTYRCWLRFLTTKIPEVGAQILCPKEATYDIIMQAMYGGRVYPSITKHEVGPKEAGWVQADICSMYPSAMMSDRFPLGAAQELDEMKLHEYNDMISTEMLEKVEELLPIGIYWCDVEPNPHLTEPVLPHRESKGGLQWTLEKRHQYLTSVDMITGLRCGYKIQIDPTYSSLIWTTEGNMFKGYVDRLFALKQQATVDRDPVKRELAKLMMNALYGKLLQSTVYTEVHAVPTESAGSYLQGVLDQGNMSWVSTSAGSSYLILSLRPDKAKAPSNYPTQLGVFTLAYSRRIFTNFLRTASPDFDRLCRWRPGQESPVVAGEPPVPVMAYNDTDSGLIPEASWQRVVAAGMEGDALGDGETAFLSNDLGPKARVMGWVAPAPKTYILRVKDGKDGKPYKIRMKGVHMDPEKQADPFYVENIYEQMKLYIDDPSRRPPELNFGFSVFKRTLNRVNPREADRDRRQSMAFTIYTSEIRRALRSVFRGRRLTPTPDFPNFTMPRLKPLTEDAVLDSESDVDLDPWSPPSPPPWPSTRTRTPEGSPLPVEWRAGSD